MRNTPGNVRFGEVEALLRYEGFVLLINEGATVLFTERMAGC